MGENTKTGVRGVKALLGVTEEKIPSKGVRRARKTTPGEGVYH